MSGSTRSYVNPYGRKGGRGIRPFFLIPKVVLLAVFVGSYTSAMVLWYYFRNTASDETWPVDAVSILFRWVIIPSLISTLLLGICLFLQHPKIFIRRRWLQAKLGLVILLPVIHFVARPTLEKIRAGYQATSSMVEISDLEFLCQRFTVCVSLGLGVALTLVFLGRYKPRLGQAPETHPTRKHASESTQLT